MASSVRFMTTSDGIRIAYCTVGAGRALVVVPSWISHLELDQDELVGPAFFELLGRGRLLVRYDKRGMGLSQRDLKDYSLEAQVADLASLIEHLGLEDFALFGSSQGGVIALAYAAKHPEVVKGDRESAGGQFRPEIFPVTRSGVAAHGRRQQQRGIAALTHGEYRQSRAVRARAELDLWPCHRSHRTSNSRTGSSNPRRDVSPRSLNRKSLPLVSSRTTLATSISPPSAVEVILAASLTAVPNRSSFSEIGSPAFRPTRTLIGSSADSFRFAKAL